MPKFEFEPKTVGAQDGFKTTLIEPTHTEEDTIHFCKYRILTFDPHEKVAIRIEAGDKVRNVALLGDGMSHKNMELIRDITRIICKFYEPPKKKTIQPDW